jgi:hypothetical protein
MEKLIKLIEKYVKLHPELEHPQVYLYMLGVEELTDLLDKALKENLVLEYVDAGVNTDDGGEITLIKKPLNL